MNEVLKILGLGLMAGGGLMVGWNSKTIWGVVGLGMVLLANYLNHV